jgi:DUF4097 and DUF4098 domain-containing protein YvlB
MSSYPPPGGGFPPPYDRQALKAQRRAMKMQVRAMRAQARMQRRALRRRSALGPLIVLCLGIVFLMCALGRVSGWQIGAWYSRWWPAILILGGVVLLAEWAVDQRRGPTLGQERVLGGGVVLLLVLLALTGLSTRGIEDGMAWHDRAFGSYSELNHLLGERHDADSVETSPIRPGTTLVIHDPNGDVTIAGGGEDGVVHVSAHTESYAWKDSDADAKARRLQPVFSPQGSDLELNVADVQGGQTDLVIQLPRNSSVTLEADHGDVNISDLAGAVNVSANHGDVEISAIHAGVNLHVNDDDATLTLHSIQGPVLVNGHGGDTSISDVEGPVTMQGDFFGSTELEHIADALRFETSRTQFTAARLDDEFSVNGDSLNASQIVGPVVLKTGDKNVTLDRVAGSVAVLDRNGSVSVTHAPPLAPISIQNRHGSIDVGLPGDAGFVLNARTHNGDTENDFGLPEQGSQSQRTLMGNVGGGGPPVTLSTSDGDVTVRRSSVAALPAMRAEPSTAAEPSAPAVPAAPVPPAPPKPPHRIDF